MNQSNGTPNGTAAPDLAGQDSLRQPRLLPLASLLGEWEADAQAAFDARVNGLARGPVTGLASLDATLGDCLAPGLPGPLRQCRDAPAGAATPAHCPGDGHLLGYAQEQRSGPRRQPGAGPAGG